MLETASPTLRVPRDSVIRRNYVCFLRGFPVFHFRVESSHTCCKSGGLLFSTMLGSSCFDSLPLLGRRIITAALVGRSFWLLLRCTKLRVQRVCTLHGVGRSRSLGVNFSLPRNGVTFDGCPLMLSFGKGSGQCTDGYPLVNLLEPQFLLAVSTSTQHFFAPATTKSVRSTGSSRKPKFSFTIQWRTTVGDVFAAFVDDILSLFMFFYRPLSADRLSIMEVAAKAVLQQRS